MFFIDNLTPRRKGGNGNFENSFAQDPYEEESKKTSGASTPTKGGADTPSRKDFIDQ